jgi:hypothetical protein
MARVSVAVSIVGGGADLAPSSAAAYQAQAATSIATLVADGASPTQSHVNTHNTDWGLLNTELNRDCVMIYDTSKVTSLAMLRVAVERLMLSAAGREEIR